MDPSSAARRAAFSLRSVAASRPATYRPWVAVQRRLLGRAFREILTPEQVSGWVSEISTEGVDLPETAA